jgi:hypothetical protein
LEVALEGINLFACHKKGKRKTLSEIDAEVECFSGHVDRLKDCQLYNDEFTNQEINHLRCF